MKFTKRSLRRNLESLGVPLERWGKRKAKTLDHLLKELNKGECQLSGIERKTFTVVLEVHHKKLRLKEVCQVFSDGRIRQRKLPWGPVGEKLRMGEGAISGLIRALKEELGIDYGFHTKVHSIKGVELTKPSKSYPGLTTVNVMARFRVVISERVYKEDYFERQPDKTTYFTWVVRRKKRSSKLDG